MNRQAALKDLGLKAEEVYGNWVGNRPDQDGGNWQAGHVTMAAAERLKGYLGSGREAGRTFQPTGDATALYRSMRSQELTAN